MDEKVKNIIMQKFIYIKSKYKKNNNMMISIYRKRKLHIDNEINKSFRY